MAFYHIFKCSTICYHGISNVFASHTFHKKSLHRLNTKCRTTCVCVCVFIIERSSLMQTYLLFPRLNATHHKKSMKIVNVMGFDESKIVHICRCTLFSIHYSRYNFLFGICVFFFLNG